MSDTAAKFYTVTDAAPPKVAGQRVAPGDVLRLLPIVARTEVEFGHLREGAEGKPLDLTDAERAALPELAPLGDGPVAYATGVAGEAAGVPLTGIEAPADGVERDVVLGAIPDGAPAPTKG